MKQVSALLATPGDKMKLRFKSILCLAVVLTGCVTYREFRGTTENLKGNGTGISAGQFLKMKLVDVGETKRGNNFIALSLPEQNCELALFYPMLRPYSYYSWRADMDTSGSRAWQILQGVYLTNYISTNLALPANQTEAWLIRGRELSHSQLQQGIAMGLPSNAEQLYGKIGMVKDGSTFHIIANLTNSTGTKISGIFDSYKTPSMLWAWPVVLIFGPEGPSWEQHSKPLPTLKTNYFSE